MDSIATIIYCLFVYYNDLLFIIAVHLPQHSINPVLCHTTIWTLICQSIKSYGNPRALGLLVKESGYCAELCPGIICQSLCTPPLRRLKEVQVCGE